MFRFQHQKLRKNPWKAARTSIHFRENEYHVRAPTLKLSHQTFVVPAFTVKLFSIIKFQFISLVNVLVNISPVVGESRVYKHAGKNTFQDIQSIRVRFSPRSDQKEPELTFNLINPQIIVIFEKGRFYNGTLLVFTCLISGKR